MEVQASDDVHAFGFLTVVDDRVHGAFGGYLVVTHHGRPLEFRCSTPVKPTRAQEILYGAALRPYLWGEVVGKTLVDSAQTPVVAILTDCPEVLSMGVCRPEEVLYVAPSDMDFSESGAPISTRMTPLAGGSLDRIFQASTSLISADRAAQWIAPLLEGVDPREPFQRIRLALCEVGCLTSGSRGDEGDVRAA